MDLTGRRAVVTGGAGGIGAAIVTDLATRGAEVVIWDLDQGVDITDRASVEHAAARIEIDILVNAAGST